MMHPEDPRNNEHPPVQHRRRRDRRRRGRLPIWRLILMFVGAAALIVIFGRLVIRILVLLGGNP